jgi:hypothetical protein
MNYQETELNRIWKKHMNDLPDWVEKRGYCYAVNTEQKDLLITGINPSCRKNEEKALDKPDYNFKEIVDDDNLKDIYWRKMQKMVYEPSLGIDLRARAAYLDIFYFRTTEQKDIKDELIRFEETNDWRNFAIAQLTLTRDTIENVIKPKLIVVANKESYAYWGRLDKYVWLGYTFDEIKETDYGKLCKITGFNPSPERIASGLTDTQLKGALVLFSEFPPAGQPSAAFLQVLLAQA